MPGWGKVLVATRLEKTVSAVFFQVWEELTKHGLRAGDGALSVRGKVAHKAQNDIVRYLLRGEWDTLFTLDSDADVGPGFLAEFRDHEPGWAYDILQAFYCRRGWPPRAIWMQRNALGHMTEFFVTNDDKTEDVDVAGTHACLIRRRVFEAMLGDRDPATFEWFYYPRHEETSEDSQFSIDAKAAGFRIGATSTVKAGHICEVTTGWQTYQDYINLTGRRVLLERYSDLAQEIAAYTGETAEMVVAKSLEGDRRIRASWQADQPNDAEETRVYYGRADNGYLYELLRWNCQPGYQQIIAPLREIHGQRVLVIGAGLGTEAEQLVDRNQVDCFDVPGELREFAVQRFGGRVWFLPVDRLTPDLMNANVYDLIVAIDTLEHVHPDEIDDVLATVAKTLKPGGVLYAHNNWGEQDKFPMHYDHSQRFTAWCVGAGMEQIGVMQWRKSTLSPAPISANSTHFAPATLSS